MRLQESGNQTLAATSNHVAEQIEKAVQYYYQPFGDTPGDGKAVEKVADYVKVICQITDFFVDIKTLGKQVNHMAVLSLVFKVDFDVFRKIFKIPIVPDQADLIDKDQAVWRELDFAKILYVKQVTAGNLAVRVDSPAFALILHGKLKHESGLT